MNKYAKFQYFCGIVKLDVMLAFDKSPGISKIENMQIKPF